MLFTAVTHTTDAPLPGFVSDVAGPTTTHGIAQPLAPNVVNMAIPAIGSACATTRHHPDLPPGDVITNQGTDIDPGPTVEVTETTKKVRKIHIAIVIFKICRNNGSKTLDTSNQLSILCARTQMK